VACFVFSIVGLLYYTLSSTFNQLFGKWTWWKILLNFVFTLCIIFFFSSKSTTTTTPPGRTRWSYSSNSEMAAAAKGMESGVFCFFYCWTPLLYSQLHFQSTIWKVDMVKNITLLCFYSLHHLLLSL